MPFAPGQSGNPGGRAKVTLPDGRSLADVAREHTMDAVSTLVEVMTDADAPPPARVSAASAILDRGWGRPTQDVDIGDNLGNILGDLLARVDGRTRAITPTFEIVG